MPMRNVLRYQDKTTVPAQQSIRPRLTYPADAAVRCVAQAVAGFDFFAVDVFHLMTSVIFLNHAKFYGVAPSVRVFIFCPFNVIGALPSSGLPILHKHSCGTLSCLSLCVKNACVK